MKRFMRDYGIILMLLVLCIFFSLMTIKTQHPEGKGAAKQVVDRIKKEIGHDGVVLIVATTSNESKAFASDTKELLTQEGFSKLESVIGKPRDLRVKLDEMRAGGQALGAIATTGEMLEWELVKTLPEKFPEFANAPIIIPKSYKWPDFLKPSNILAIVDRIVVIAVIAIGMTMVIITGGIDLSVGSLIALSAVISTLVMKKMGGLEAGPFAVFVGFVVGTLSCTILGALGGYLVATFRVAPFITTLALMMVGRGWAFLMTGGFSIYQVPATLTWLGQGRSFFGIPNTVVMLIILYALAHIFMSRTVWGRYIYAVGGNMEAARLSGVPIKRVLLFVYIVCSLMAGWGGCIQASQVNTGTPTYGQMYEMYVIAACVVGGTSLAGGSGKILGTLIGAFIISVIQNGMNLLGIESYTQQIVLGLVILGAVLLDKIRNSGGFQAIWAKKAQ